MGEAIELEISRSHNPTRIIETLNGEKKEKLVHTCTCTDRGKGTKTTDVLTL